MQCFQPTTGCPQRGVRPSSLVKERERTGGLPPPQTPSKAERERERRAVSLEQATQNLAAVRGFLQGNAYHLCGVALTEVLLWHHGGAVRAPDSQEQGHGGPAEWPTAGAAAPTQVDLQEEDPGDAEREAMLDLELQRQHERSKAAQEEDHDLSDEEATVILAQQWDMGLSPDFGAQTCQEMQEMHDLQHGGAATQAEAEREAAEAEAMAEYERDTGRRRVTSSPTDRPTPASSPEPDSSD
ncbi:unnamed protein product [Symbiodinium sp. CCMP2592]|nr:unnamed protein product [Symbiodinium sp. CCMP2592]